MTDQVLDAQVVEEPGQEVVQVAPAAPVSLFRTEDPAEVLQRAKAVADALAPVIRGAGLVSNIQGKDYLQVEAWQVCGQQVGVTPVVTSTRRLIEPDGWEARCEARTLDGRTIGAADSMCLRTEERWKDSEDFEIRSMAQTRAMSRALASVLRFIPTLAGMAGTPAEEMDRVAAQKGSGPRKPSAKQLEFFERLAKDAGFMNEELSVLMAWAGEELTGGKEGSVSNAIDGLKQEGTRTDTADRLGRASKEWASKQSDVPADTEGLGASAGDDGDIPF
jgi:hypothetical protein